MATHQFEFGDVSCGDLARRLIAEGADRSDKLQMLRDGKPVYSGSVGWFAKRTVRENAKEGPVYVKWRPFPDVRRRALAASSDPEVS